MAAPFSIVVESFFEPQLLPGAYFKSLVYLRQVF